MLPSTRDAQAARLPNHPAIPAIYHTVGVFVHAEGRAEHSRAKQRTMQAQLQILQMTSTTQSEGR